MAKTQVVIAEELIQMLYSAKAFHDNCLSILKKYKEDNDGVDVLISYIDYSPLRVAAVSISFALELYIKGISSLKNNMFIREHALADKLYANLDDDIKSEIEDAYQVEKSTKRFGHYPMYRNRGTKPEPPNIMDIHERSDLNVENVLIRHNDCFINWRYSFQIKDETIYAEFDSLLYLASALNKLSKNKLDAKSIINNLSIKEDILLKQVR